MAKKKSIAEQALELAEKKRKNTSSYSAANTDHDASVAERALELANKRRDERIRLAAAAVEPVHPERPTYSRPPLASKTPSIDRMARDEAMAMLLGEDARNLFDDRGSVARNLLNQRIEQAVRNAAEGAKGEAGLATKKKQQPEQKQPATEYVSPWTPEQIATTRAAVERAAYPTEAIEREFHKNDPEALAMVDEKYSQLRERGTVRKLGAELLSPDVMQWLEEETRKAEKKGKQANAWYTRALGDEGITQAEAEYIQRQYDDANRTFWQKAKDAIGEDLENLYDFTIGRTMGYLWQLKAEDEANNAEGATVGELGQAMIGRVGGGFNDFLLGIAENYNDATNELMNLLGVKADHNYFTGLRNKNAETMAAFTAAADENATWKQRMLLDTASNAANSYIMAYMGRGLGTATNNLAGGGNHAVNPLLKQNRIANAVTAAQMAPFAVQSANEAYDAAEEQGLSGWQKSASAITAMFMSYAANSSTFDDYMERVGLGVAGNAEMMARNAAARSMSMSERAYAWLTDTLMGMSTGEGVQEVVESLTLKLNNDMWAGTFFDAEGWNEWSQQARQDFVSGYISGAVFNAATLPSYFASNRMYRQMMNGDIETTPENIAELIVQTGRDSQTPEGQAAIAQATEQAQNQQSTEQSTDYLRQNGIGEAYVAREDAERNGETPGANLFEEYSQNTPAQRVGEQPAVQQPATQRPAQIQVTRPQQSQTTQRAEAETSAPAEGRFDRLLRENPELARRVQQRAMQAMGITVGEGEELDPYTWQVRKIPNANNAQSARSSAMPASTRSESTSGQTGENRPRVSDLTMTSRLHKRGKESVNVKQAYRTVSGIVLEAVDDKGRTFSIGIEDANIGNSETAELLRSINSNSKLIGTPGQSGKLALDACLNHYDTSLGTIDEYVKAFDAVFEAGQKWLPADNLRSDERIMQHLTEAAFNEAYDAGLRGKYGLYKERFLQADHAAKNGTAQTTQTAVEDTAQPTQPVTNQPANGESTKPSTSAKVERKKITGKNFISGLEMTNPSYKRGRKILAVVDVFKGENGMRVIGVDAKGVQTEYAFNESDLGESRTVSLLRMIDEFGAGFGRGENGSIEINECIKRYDSEYGSMEEYVKDFSTVCKSALMGMSQEEIKGDYSYKGHLSDKAFEAAYNIGAEKAPKIEYKTPDQRREEAAEAYKKSGKKPEGAIELAEDSVFFAGTVKFSGKKGELSPVALSANEESERVVTAIDSDGKLHTEKLGNVLFENETAQQLFGRFWVDTFDIDQHRGNGGMASRLTDEALPAYSAGYDADRVSGEDVTEKVAAYAKEFYRVYKAGERGQTLEQMADGDEQILARIHEVLSDETIDSAYKAGHNTPEAQKARRLEEVRAQKVAESYAKAGMTQPAAQTAQESKPVAETKAEEPAVQPKTKQPAQEPESKSEARTDTAKVEPEQKAEVKAQPAAVKEEPQPSSGKKPQNFRTQHTATVTDEYGDKRSVQVVGVESVEDDAVVLRVLDENGHEDYCLSSDLDFGNDMDELLDFAGARALDARGMRNYLEGYDSGIATPEQYAQAFTSVYQRAASGLEYETAVNQSYTAQEYLTGRAATSAFSAGMNAYNQTHDTVQAAEVRNESGVHVADENVSLSAQEGRKRGKISKRYSQSAWTNLGKDGQKNAIAQMEMLTAMASRTKHTIVVEDSIVDKQGNHANAYYNPKTREVHVALDTIGGAYAYAAAHELGHAMKAEHSEAEWNEFSGYIKDTLSKNGQNWDELVQYQMDRFGYTLAEAQEEVVCNTIPAMLQDESNLMKLYKGNRTLFERIVDWVNGMLQDIKTAGEVLSKRSKSWSQMDALKNDRQSLQEMYDRMMAVMEKGAEKQTSQDVKQSVNDTFEAEYDAWAKEKKLNQIVNVGTTSNVLVNLGAKEQRVIMRSEDILHALRHEGMSDAIMKQIPEMMENPIIVMKSSQLGNKNNHQASRVVMYGSVNDENGVPVIAVLELRERQKGGQILDIQLVKNAYGKDNRLDVQILNSEILYLDPNKKRTNEWLHSLRLQLPSDTTNYGSVGIITYPNGFVKMDGVMYDDLVGGKTITNSFRGEVSEEQQVEQNALEGVRPSVMEAPVTDNGEVLKYSLATYEEEMPKPISVGRANALGLDYQVKKLGAKGKRTVTASGRDVTAALMKKEGHDQKTIDKVLRYGDRVSKWFEKAVGKYQYVNLQDVNDASIMIDHNTGEIKFSCQVPNSEYKVNFDFTTVCRQREAVQRFIDDLAREQGKNGTKLEDISLTPQNIFRLNTILKNEGYETACLGCFVEAKRYRVKQQADTLVEEWNALVLAKNPNAEYFGFATGDTDLMKMSDDEVTKLEASMRAYNTKGTSKATDRAARLVELPEMQKLIRPSDFISRQGRQKIREFSPALESFLASRFGQGGAKPAVGFMPYNSEIAALPDTKSVGGKRMTLQAYLKNLGGARSNSFSDYIPTHALDYLQRTMDMAARKLPAQCYTKVPGRARTFGMTGEKINMSVMFDIDPSVHWSSAGLDSNGEYMVGDKARADKVQQETGERPFTQSFPWEEAVAIEHDPRYAENCGIIGVGYSYNHIAKMQGDDNVPYIIPYHRSSMPDSVAKASNTKHATNYEPVQNNTRVTGYAVVTNLDEGEGVPSYATWPEGKKKTKASDLTWDMQAALKRNGGDAKATIAEWHEWMQENDLTPVTSTAEAGHGKYDVYATLEATKDPAATAEDYMLHCLENGMLPVFYEFATMDGYDKHLFDFSVRNLATGGVSLQKPVSFDFMDGMDADDFIAQLDGDMSEYNEYNREQFFSDKWGRVKDTAYQELQDEGIKFSMRDTDENVQDALTAEQKAYEQVKGHRITAAEADKLAGTILKQANSDYDQQKLAAELSRIYDYIERGEDVDWAQVDDEKTALMARVMEKSKALNLEHEEMAKPIRDYFKRVRISLSDSQRSEAASLADGIGAYRRMLFGSVRLANSGVSLDSAWSELSDLNPELFPADAGETDMPALLLQAADAIKPVYDSGMGMNVEESANWLAGKMDEAYFALPAVKAAAQSAKTFGESVAALKNAMKRFEETSWSEYQNALRSIKEAKGEQAKTQKQQELAALRKKYQQWREKDTAARNERELKAKYRSKTERTVKTLTTWLNKPTDAKHVPAEVDKCIRQMLTSLDFSGKTTKTATELSDQLNSLADALLNAQEGEDENRTIFLERDQQMIDEIKRVAELIRGNAVHQQRVGRGVYDLTGAEMRELSKWLDVVKHVVTKAGTMRGSNLPGESVEQVAAASMEEIRRKTPHKDKKWITKEWNKHFGVDMQDSFAFFERLGATSNAVFKGLRQGFDKMAGLVADAEEHTKKILDGADLKHMTGKHAKKQTFQLQSGKVELTKAQIMEMYVLSKREQAQGHLYGGGFRLIGDENAHPYTISKAELNAITGTLTADEKRIADGMQRFLSKECANWGNQASMELLGYRKFGEENYWPISTDANSRNTTKLEDNYAANISAIKNQGMTKALTEGAKNAIMIGDIFDTYTRHISNMSAYSAYALPLSDFTRWYNSRGVKTEIEHALGKDGLKYINNFLMAVNGSAMQQEKSGLSKVAGVLTRNAKIASVGANMRVVVQQPTSYARAAMYISPKYLGEALVMKKPDEDLVNKYCAIAHWKRWGFYETNVGPNLRQLIVGDTSFADKTREVMMKPAAMGDDWTLNHLWNACEMETREVYPELKRGSDEYYKQVGARMSEIIDRTQVVDSVFHRSQMMRSKNPMDQMLTNFMAEPTKTYNMLMSAISEYADNRRNKAARNRLARAFTVYSVTGLLTSAAAAVVDAFRDDDEEKEWLEKYTDALKGNAVDNLNPIGLLPGVKDILSLLQGYEASRLDQQSIQRIVWAAQEIKKYTEGESKLNMYGLTYKVTQALSSLVGIPASNIMRDVNAIIQTVTGYSPTASPEARKNNTVSRLYAAMKSGTKADAQKLREELLGEKVGMTNKEIDTALANLLANDPQVIAAWTAKSEKRYADANRAHNALTARGFDHEMVDKAIQAYGNSVTPKEKSEKDPNAVLNVVLYSTEEVASAIRIMAGVERGGSVTEADIRSMISDRVAGSSASDPEKSVISAVQSELKKSYLAMETSGDTEGMRKLGTLMTNVLGTTQETMDSWVKEQHSANLKAAVLQNDSAAARSAVAVMRADGKTDSQIKSSLSSFKEEYIAAVQAGDNETANAIRAMLMSLGLKGKNGNALYTTQTFVDWLR